MKGVDIENILKREIKSIVRKTIYDRGMQYYKGDDIADFRIEDSGGADTLLIEGCVFGSTKYYVNFVFDLEDNSFMAIDCSCPCDFECKHFVALALKFTAVYRKFWEENSGDFFDLYDAKDEFLEWYEMRNAKPLNIENEADHSLDEEILSKLRSVGIDTNLMPPDLLQSFKESYKLQNKSSQENITKVKNNVKLKPFAERYEVVISMSYIFTLKIRKKKERNKAIMYGHFYEDSYEYGELQSLIDKELNLTDSQKEFLFFIDTCKFYERDVDIKKLFNLIEKSGLGCVYESYSSEKKVTLNLEPQEKLQASLFNKEEPVYFVNQNEVENTTRFVLLFDEKLLRRKCDEAVIVKSGIVILKNKNIYFYEISDVLSDLIFRVFEKYDYVLDERYCAFLISKEVTNLNKIIEELRKCFALETDLDSDFLIKKFAKAEKTLLVDYDAEARTLQIDPVIDYGFYKVYVNKSVFVSYKGGQRKLRRRDNLNKEIDGYFLDVSLQDKTIFYAKVAKSKEINFYKELAEGDYGFTKTAKVQKKGNKAVINYYKKYWDSLKSLGCKIVILNDELGFEFEDFKADFNVDFNADNDWLAFDVDCYCGENKITLDTLRNYIKGKDEFLRSDDGKVLRIKNRDELEKFLFMLDSFYQKENSSNEFEGKIYHAPELENVFTSSKYYNAKLDSSFKKFMKEAKAGKPVNKVKMPAKFKKIMRDYQLEGMDWFHFLRKYRFAGILADDMGLGKTLQALFLIDMNAAKGKPSLVVCPKTLLYNWQMEAKKFTPKMKTIVVDGQPEERRSKIKKVHKHDLIITSYPLLQRDLEHYKKHDIKFNYCVLDEAQFIKNHKTKNSQVVKRVDADYRLALTGTPLENTVEEIWSIFDFLMPGFLGSHPLFSKKFLRPIMKQGCVKSLKNLREKTSCFMLRRTKEEVLKELPPKIENVNYCHLEDSQNVLYQEILANVKSDIFNTVKQKGFAKSQIHILAGLTKLRQVCNHPVLLLKDKKYDNYDSAKLEAFNELIGEMVASGKKVLVFSQFTQMLDILKEELNKNKVDHLYLSGQTRNRQVVIDDFNNDESKKVFLISLKAGGVGLNLTAAENVIIFDPWWNPSVEKQAVDRAHRIGQKKSVNVYRLITKGTIEERIVELQKKKQNLFDNLVGESADMFKKLTWDDVQNLFR